jgi:hypothetical protein
MKGQTYGPTTAVFHNGIPFLQLIENAVLMPSAFRHNSRPPQRETQHDNRN